MKQFIDDNLVPVCVVGVFIVSAVALIISSIH